MEDEVSNVLMVKFYQRAVENEFRSKEEGRPVSEMKDFVVIDIPGNQYLQINTFANDDHKKRFPREWAHFMNEKSGGDYSGTLLSNWPLLNAAQANELKHFKFFTVEQVAEASDQQINAIGMLLGMAPHAFRDKARLFLSASKDAAVVQNLDDELRKRDAELDEMRAEIARLQPAKRGRKPNEITA